MARSTVYKILSAEEWARFQREGMFDGAAADRADGFIHLSAPHQVAATAAKHFAGQMGLWLLAVDADALGPALCWEVSRGGQLFPHYYGELPIEAVLSVHALPLDAEGRHRFPPGTATEA